MLALTEEKMRAFSRYARLIDYKDRTKLQKEPFDYTNCPDPDKNTVTLCGVCVGTNQLGNIMFGIISEIFGLGADSLAFGRGENNDKLLNQLLGVQQSNPWTRNGEAYREHAFRLGRQYQIDVALDVGPVNFCERVKNSQGQLNGPQFNTDASTKVPCGHKHTGPNTDMRREPLTDAGGNSKK